MMGCEILNGLCDGWVVNLDSDTHHWKMGEYCRSTLLAAFCLHTSVVLEIGRKTVYCLLMPFICKKDGVLIICMFNLVC